MRICIVSLFIVSVTAQISHAQLAAGGAERSAAGQEQKAGAVPDLSGVWMGRELTKTFKGEPHPPLQPWAEAKFKETQAKDKADHAGTDPYLSCYPPGIPRILLIPFPIEIIQMPGRVIMFFEYDHFVRQIYTDGREHPKADVMDPTWMGDAIGKWENDTLVVDTVGFNDKTWLDMLGLPHSDALHVVERIRRVDHATLQDDITIEDPKTFTKPWKVQKEFQLRPKWDITEYVCQDTLEKPNIHPLK